MQGSSGWRQLREAETEAYGGSSRRVLYGCVVTLISDDSSISSVPGSRMLVMEDENQSLLLCKDATNFPSHAGAGSFKADKGWHSGSKRNFNIASTITNTTFKQLLFTWSRVYYHAFPVQSYFTLISLLESLATSPLRTLHSPSCIHESRLPKQY